MKYSIDSQMKYTAITLTCLLIVVSLLLGTTPAALASGPASVNLGSAGNFAVLASSTVTNVVSAGTIVTGDLGLSPGSAVTGFPPGVLNGTQHVADNISAWAQDNLTVAYNDAAGRSTGAITVAGNIGGQTLTPGLYKSTSSLAISSGDLTLDAQGDIHAVWIFQIASTLTTTSGRQVILAGGAQAKNVFWQVGTSATLGTTTIFKGTIMANESISLLTGATLEGRALARTGAVTLDSNVISLPVAAGAAGITGITPSSVSPAYASVGGTVTVNFTVAFDGTIPAEGYIYLQKSGVNRGSGVYFSFASPSLSQAASYPITIPAGTENGTFDLFIEARQPQGSGTWATALSSSSVIVSTGNFVVAPTLSSPASGVCTNDNTPTFIWNTVPPSTNLYTIQWTIDPTFTTYSTFTTAANASSYTTGTLSDGLYYWRVRTQDQYGNVSLWSSAWTLCVDTAASLSTPVNATPSNGALQSASYNPTYTWSASTGDSSSCGTLQYIVETYNNSGMTPTYLVDNATVGATSYTSNTLFLANTTYYWRVMAFNCAGRHSSWSTSTSFSMGLSGNTYTIPLSAGWNLISLPLVPTSTTLTTVMAPILPYLQEVAYFSYSTTTPNYIWWLPGAGALTTIEAGKAYWVLVSQSCTLTGTGVPCAGMGTSTAAPSLPLYPLYTSTNYPDGWNMIGFKSTQPLLAGDATHAGYFSGVASKFSYPLYRWAGGWALVASTENLTPGTGYFMQVNTAGNLVAPCQ